MKKKTMKQSAPKAMKAAKAKAAPKAPPSQVEKARKLPVMMFHTLKGPVVGHCKPGGTKSVRLWAPAVLSMPTPANVLYLPVTFCEEYVDLQFGLIWGTSPVPKIVEDGYRGFVDQFVQGSYRMQPLVMNAGVEAEEHTSPLAEGTDPGRRRTNAVNPETERTDLEEAANEDEDREAEEDDEDEPSGNGQDHSEAEEEDELSERRRVDADDEG